MVFFLICARSVLNVKKVHRGTLHEMIKNEANKCAKQTEPKAAITAPTAPTATTTTTTTVRQQSNEVDNRHALTSIQRTVTNKYNEIDDNDAATAGKPLTKLDLIKKFDSKYKQPNTIDNKQSHRTSYEESQQFNDPDEVENDENIQNSNDFQPNDVEIQRRSSESESTTIANNNYKNSNANGNMEALPPKPLPRTSRNNSVSSLSSEHSISIVNPVVVVEETVRPVAKPRTTTTSYKVQPSSTF